MQRISIFKNKNKNLILRFWGDRTKSSTAVTFEMKTYIEASLMRQLDKHKHLVGTFLNQDDERENITIESLYVKENDDPKSLKEMQKRID